jgi:hypothetical protein
MTINGKTFPVRPFAFSLSCAKSFSSPATSPPRTHQNGEGRADREAIDTCTCWVRRGNGRGTLGW